MRAMVAAVFGSLLALGATAAEWRDVGPPGATVSRAMVHPTQPARILTFDTSWVSEDGGSSWTHSAAPSDVDRWLVHRARPGTVFAHERHFFSRLLRGNTGGDLHRSDDFGRTWGRVVTVGQSAGGTPAAVGSDPENPDRLLGTLRTTAACLPVFPCTDATDGDAVESFDGGATWSSLSALSATSLAAPVPGAARTLVAAGGGIKVSRDGGRSFVRIATPFDRASLAVVDPVHADRWFAYSGRPEGGPWVDLWRTDDAGGRWYLVLSVRAAAPSAPEIYMSQSAPGRLLVSGVREGVLLSDDGGDRWRALGLAAGEPPCSICEFYEAPWAAQGATYSAADPYRIYAAFEGRLRVLELPRPQAVDAVEYHLASVDRYWMTVNGGEVEAFAYGAQPGAVRTQQRLRFLDVSAAGTAMCRFQGNPAYGLHTRFMTLDGPECSALRASPAWILEGFDEYRAVMPAAAECPQGTTPVRRFLKSQQDVNHRYVTPSHWSEMRSRGWVEEGVAMCAG